MSKKSVPAVIRLRGVRHHNLKNFDLDLPIGQLIVITGLSGSGKSSLAFDTLFAEGQRRYIETFSPYARQFFDRMDKPQVDRIEGIPPAIAIEQRNAVKTTRSTVGTMTELTDYMKLLWPHLATLHCRQCGAPVKKESPSEVWTALNSVPAKSRSGEKGEGNGEFLITFAVPLSEKLSFAESMALIAKQGYQRLLLNGGVMRIDEALASSAASHTSPITVIQDRLKTTAANRSRFVEACEQAFHFGKGKLTVFEMNANGRPFNPRFFSNRYHCATCDIDYREPSAPLFSFNHPLGACPACRGFGRVITIDYNLAIPDRSKPLGEGAIKPWQVGHGLDSQRDLAKACKAQRVPMNVPFAKLSTEHQKFVLEGDPDYGKDEEHEWPRAWYGLKGYFRWLESKAYKMHVRVLLARYRAYTTCPDCKGKRFQPESLLYSWQGMTLSDFYQLPVRDALSLVERMAPPSRNGGVSAKASLPERSRDDGNYPLPRRSEDDLVLNDALPVAKDISRDEHCGAGERTLSEPIRFAFQEIRARLHYLNEVGLGYLTLDRPTRSLSGGETERVNLTTCLGTRLVNTLYVLDEPSVGLHPRDTERLVNIVQQLRDIGNTVVVVEHEPAVMRAANHIVDLGPGHGESGGEVIYAGALEGLLKHPRSLTGQYLSGRKELSLREPRRVDKKSPKLRIEGANVHNLKNLAVEIPLNRFVCLTGVSGSGKTTLARDILYPLLQQKLGPTAFLTEQENEESSNGEAEPEQMPLALLTGFEPIGEVVMVDQSALGRTPRSNPAVYIGAFESIREIFAATEEAKQRGLNASAFSFNSGQGQCEKCRGAGFEKIEMQFLSDVFVMCADCNGRRYREHILEVKLQSGNSQSWSIADLLDATIDEVIAFLGALPESRSRARALSGMKLLQDVGLGYLRAGQPINTLSGGESQRLKLVSHLAEFANNETRSAGHKPKFFIFDEPTTGLHFDDVRVLVEVFQKLVDEGHSLLVIEHNLELIRCADWLIDLGPDAGDRGGEVVGTGTPDELASNRHSFTGQALQRSNNS
jgi:excinuclease ABC subunit A